MGSRRAAGREREQLQLQQDSPTPLPLRPIDRFLSPLDEGTRDKGAEPDAGSEERGGTEGDEGCDTASVVARCASVSG